MPLAEQYLNLERYEYDEEESERAGGKHKV